MNAGTIFAAASGAAPSGVSVIRISGPDAGPALSALTTAPLPEARRATLARLGDPGSGAVLDVALVLWFPGPASFTGEDTVELHVHGGRAVVAAVLAALGGLQGLRAAEAGEFTRRAFDNGKLDLTEVEGLADLIAAETEAQRTQALRQMEGGLSRVYERWRTALIAASAHLEATIDFSDEDIPEGLVAGALESVRSLRRDIVAHLADGRRGERLRDGIHIAIVGPPNAGKSSLLNWLARRDAAIVSDVAGTTRDIVEVHLDLDGYPVVLADTAGLRETADLIEEEGVRRALVRAGSADLTLVVIDGAAGTGIDDTTRGLIGPDALVAINKADLGGGVTDPVLDGVPCFSVSISTGAGMEGLLAAIGAQVKERWGLGGDATVTRARHRHGLEQAVAGLDRALAGTEPELIGEDLRLAARALGAVTGRVGVEDILDVIFQDFCIGK